MRYLITANDGTHAVPKGLAPAEEKGFYERAEAREIARMVVVRNRDWIRGSPAFKRKNVATSVVEGIDEKDAVDLTLSRIEDELFEFLFHGAGMYGIDSLNQGLEGFKIRIEEIPADEFEEFW